MEATTTTNTNTNDRMYGILLWNPFTDKWQVVNNRIRFGSLDAAVERAEAELGKTAESNRGEIVDGKFVAPSFTVQAVRAYNVHDGDDYAVVGSIEG